MRSIPGFAFCVLTSVLCAAALAGECKVEIRPPLVQPATRDGHRDREIYGWQLMTHQERDAFLERWKAARTPAEREALRQRNHKAMEERARERGVTLPAPPQGPSEGGPHPVPALRSACVDEQP
jgi:predicted Fe-S protein YdhL (DUF1289 family)